MIFPYRTGLFRGFVSLTLLLSLGSLSAMGAAPTPVQSADGRITFTPPAPGVPVSWDYKPTRWGRYDVEASIAAATAGAELQVEIAGQTFAASLPAINAGTAPTNVVVGRFYLAKSDPFTVLASPKPASTAPFVLQAIILKPAPEGGPIAQAADGVVTLQAGDATTHSIMMRYEPATNKNCLGYWVNPADWADWKFKITRSGAYDVELWQGCGQGQGGSEVAVEVGGERLPFVVEESGHFQNFIPRRLGRVSFPAAGMYSLAVKPQRKQAAAVMDIRQVRLVPANTAAVPAPGARAFVAAKRVVVLGDSITYAGGWVELVETWLLLNFPEADVEFLNLGLPSETVSGLSEPGHAGGEFPRPDLHERLGRVLEQAKPDLIMACYGMNDGIYYPFGEERFKKFQDGIKRLHERAAHEGVRVVHLTPPAFDPVPLAGRTLPAGLAEYRSPYEGYNQVLDRYSEWLMGQRAQGWEVVDVHGPMNRFLAEQRKAAPKFLLAGDGVHVNEQGQWLIAREVLRDLGAADRLVAADDSKALTQSYPHAAEVLTLVQQRQRALKDSWLTAIGHLRPGMSKGPPLAEAERSAAALTEQLRTTLK